MHILNTYLNLNKKIKIKLIKTAEVTWRLNTLRDTMFTTFKKKKKKKKKEKKIEPPTLCL